MGPYFFQNVLVLEFANKKGLIVCVFLLFYQL